MKCPSCNNENRIVLDMHADGYAQNLIECNACGAMWVVGVEETVVVKHAA